jgi:hypothetical protein
MYTERSIAQHTEAAPINSNGSQQNSGQVCPAMSPTFCAHRQQGSQTGRNLCPLKSHLFSDSAVIDFDMGVLRCALGARQPIKVGAVPNDVDTPAIKNASFAERDAALSTDEALNVRVYRQAAPAVANILTKATEYDFWMDPVPVEGAGSGFVIDRKGYILTNFHVVQQTKVVSAVSRARSQSLSVRTNAMT